MSFLTKGGGGMRSEWFTLLHVPLAYSLLSGLSIIYIPNYSSYLCHNIALGFASSFKVKKIVQY